VAILLLALSTEIGFSQKKPMLIQGAAVEAVTLTSGGGYKNINCGAVFNVEVKRFRLGAGIFFSGGAQPYLGEYHISNYEPGAMIKVAYALKKKTEARNIFEISLIYLNQSFSENTHFPELDTVFNVIRDNSRQEVSKYHEFYANIDYFRILSSHFRLHGTAGTGICMLDNKETYKPFWNPTQVVMIEDVRFAMAFMLGVVYVIRI
jgi:hypothetical protein